MCTGGMIVCNMIRGITFAFFTTTAARVLHNRMFSALLSAPMSFYDSNPLGKDFDIFIYIRMLNLHEIAKKTAKMNKIDSIVWWMTIKSNFFVRVCTPAETYGFVYGMV